VAVSGNEYGAPAVALGGAALAMARAAEAGWAAARAVAIRNAARTPKRER